MILKVAFKNEDSIKGLQELLNNYPLIELIKLNETSDKINDDVNINVSISIISDSYVIDNIYAIKYVSWMNNLWKVTDIDIERPRITLTLGGLYNG